MGERLATRVVADRIIEHGQGTASWEVTIWPLGGTSVTFFPVIEPTEEEAIAAAFLLYVATHAP